MTCGIYALSFEGIDKVYIGQSTNIEKRFNSHMHYLRKQKDENEKLHRAYIEFGEPNLNILKICIADDLDLEELSLINEFDSINNGFNVVLPINGAGRGTSAPGSKYSKKQLLAGLEYLLDNKLTMKDVELITGINKSTFHDIINQNGHYWFQEEYPENLVKLKELAEYRRVNGKTSLFTGKKYCDLISPSGEIITDITNIRALARKLNLDPGSLNKLINGKLHVFKGYKRYGS